MWTPWHRQAWRDRSNRKSRKASGIRGLSDIKPENRGWCASSIGPGVRADFLVNVRPDRELKESKRIQGRCNKKPDLAANKPRPSVSSLFRHRRACPFRRARCSLSGGNPAVSFLFSAVCLLGFAADEMAAVAAASYSLTHPASVPLP